MSTDLYAVSEEDDIDLVTNIMDWRHVRHVPVENSKGELVGLITSGVLVHYLSNLDPDEPKTSVREIMIADPISINPETLTIEALSLMKSNRISCLPVIKGKKLVGIVTEHDFVDISSQLFKEILSQKDET
jgi:CBS domain-containing protein